MVGQFFNAASAVSLSGMIFPRRYPPSAVIKILALASAMRSARALALNPPNTTECTAPTRAQPSIAIGSSGTMGI